MTDSTRSPGAPADGASRRRSASAIGITPDLTGVLGRLLHVIVRTGCDGEGVAKAAVPVSAACSPAVATLEGVRVG